jgi:hypothetical protein
LSDFYVSTSNSRLDAHRQTVDSINTVVDWFFVGFTRVTGTETVEKERIEVYQVSLPTDGGRRTLAVEV